MNKEGSEHEDRVANALKTLIVARTTGGNAALAMSELEIASNGLSLSGLDKWERKFQAELWIEDYVAPAPSRWPWFKPKARPAQSDIPFLVDLCCGDGFKREKTLRMFSGAAPNSFFLALAFRRLNDWVPQVREAARTRIPAIANATPPGIVAEALFATLANWSTWGRLEEKDSQALLNLLAQPELSNALLHMVVRNTKGPVSRVYSQLMKSPAFDQYLPKISSTAVQPFVRARAYRCLLEQRVSWVKDVVEEWQDMRYMTRRKRFILAERKLDVNTSFVELLRKSSEDRSPAVRRVAAELLIREVKSLGPEALIFARKFSKDSYPSVAERGEFALKLIGEQSAY